MNFDLTKTKLNEISKSIEIIDSVFNIDEIQQELDNLHTIQQSPDFFSDVNRVQEIGKKIASLEKQISKLKFIKTSFKTISEVFLECSENDTEMLDALQDELLELAHATEQMRLTALLNGKYDKLGAILSIQSGAGGTEAQDWAEMLLRMYTRYAEKNGYDIKILDYTEGDGAGIKGATVKIDGEYVYGYLKAEKGVHRLVRISPFDSNARRHTSFASVEVMPQIEDDADIEIKDSDLKIDTFHSGGNGGQGVNTTDSAVRIRHIPTGIVVQCQNERSQIQNKETALNVLKSKLAQLQEEEKQANLKEVQGGLKKIEWGSQIRSYVFCPYTMVKDHRTDYETSNVEAVMDGDLNGFITEYLKKSSIKKD